MDMHEFCTRHQVVLVKWRDRLEEGSTFENVFVLNKCFPPFFFVDKKSFPRGDNGTTRVPGNIMTMQISGRLDMKGLGAGHDLYKDLIGRLTTWSCSLVFISDVRVEPNFPCPFFI